MSKQIKQLVALCVLLTVCAGIASADLVAHWKFDEGSGVEALDSSGNGNDGALEGDPQWVAGQLGGALEGNGSSDLVRVPHSASLDITDAVTVAFWMFGGTPPDQPISKGEWNTSYGVRLDDAGGRLRQVNWRGRGPAAPAPGNALNSVTALPDGEWVHVAVTFDVAAPGDNQKIFINGVVDVANRSETPLNSNTDDVRLFAEGWSNTNRFIYGGMLDDIRIYDEALPESEIPAVMKGQAEEVAFGPYPEDGVIDVPRNVMLQWKPGKFAVQHAVHLGTSFTDVNEASTDAALSVQDANAYNAGVLDFDQTYYWRVDEVNGAPDNTVFKGDVWSFTAEPFSIPVESLSATASSSHAANMSPDNTINGVGLDELDQHSTEATEMWLSGMGDVTPSIQYEFDKAYKLHELWVWNSNQLIEAFVGLGAKDVSIEYSIDGAEWMSLENVPEFAQAPGNTSYTANTIVDFGGAVAKFVKLTVNAGYGMLPQYGLSEVRFLYIPTLPREPQPADGAGTDAATVTLKWRAGREAAVHQVYLGTDEQALTLVDTTNDSSYLAAALDYDTSYYWQIVEVNEAEMPASHAGDVWSFTTPAYGTVDDFDQYDDKCNRIFFAWEDGLGHNGGEDVDNCDEPASSGNGGGSIVGNAVAPFAERTIVNAGSAQSMPFNYDNAFGPSETTLSFAAQDWTGSGTQTLSLAFSGTEGNTGTLYVKINNSKILYDQNPADIAKSGWLAWNIDLSAVSGLGNVTSLTIGVDGASASGMLYIDDIRLYPLAGDLITPTDPGNANLAGAWNFDEGSGAVVPDSSGNGNDGSIEGNANSWVPGKQGTALSMGNNVYVSVPAAAWSSIDSQFTVAFWVFGDDALGNNWGFYAGDAAGRLAGCHLPWGNEVIFDSTANWAGERIIKPATADELRGQWHHWTFVKNADSGDKQVYLDGQLYGSASASADPITGVDRFFIGAGDAGVSQYLGLMDEFQLYNRALSAEEALWLAGGTSPIHKPF
jgi:hypothetical protein